MDAASGEVREEGLVPVGTHLVVKRVPVERGCGIALEGPANGLDEDQASSSSGARASLDAGGRSYDSKDALAQVLSRGAMLRPRSSDGHLRLRSRRGHAGPPSRSWTRGVPR